MAAGIGKPESDEVVMKTDRINEFILNFMAATCPKKLGLGKRNDGKISGIKKKQRMEQVAAYSVSW